MVSDSNRGCWRVFENIWTKEGWSDGRVEKAV
jgi:hypothetical protein